jgi:hypothetical protein
MALNAMKTDGAPPATTHRAVLKTRDYVHGDGTVVPAMRETVPLGKEYVVHAGHPAAGRRPLRNRIVQRTFDVELVWVTDPSVPDDAGGLMMAQLLDIDEGPMDRGGAR